MAAEVANVFLNQVDSGGRNVQRRILGKSQRQILIALAILADRFHSHESRDAMGDVNDVVSIFEIEEGIDWPRSDDLLDPAALLVTMKKLVMPQQRDGPGK